MWKPPEATFQGQDETKLIMFANFQNTLMLVLMGQFLDHDITLSPESEVHLEDCCVTEQDRLSDELQDKCFAVKVPEDDAQFNDRSGNRQASCSRPPHVTDRVGDFGVRSGGLCICKLMRPHRENWRNPHTYNHQTCHQPSTLSHG